MGKKKGDFFSRNSLTSVYQLEVMPKDSGNSSWKLCQNEMQAQKGAWLLKGRLSELSSAAPCSRADSHFLKDNHARSSEYFQEMLRIFKEMNAKCILRVLCTYYGLYKKTEETKKHWKHKETLFVVRAALELSVCVCSGAFVLMSLLHAF